MVNLDQAVEQALAGRKARRRGDELEFLCVAHDETTASAAWNARKGVWNCIVPSCGATGTTRDLAERLGIPVPEQKRFDNLAARIQRTYDYRDEEGKLLFQAVRLHSPKDFFQRQPDGRGGWVNNIKGRRRVLWRLPELMALPPGSTVYLCEGEKDVEAVEREGQNATTNPMGAEKLNTTELEPLYSHHVVVLLDADEAGDLHGLQAGKLLHGKVLSLRVVKLPGLEWKKKGGPDASDWLAQGHTLEELKDWPEYLPPAKPYGLAGYEHTDAGNAEAFIQLYGDQVRYDHDRGRWLIWRGHRWGPDPNGRIWRMALETARARRRAAAELDKKEADALWNWAKASESTAKINAMLDQLKRMEPVADTGAGWDAQPMLLGCENGVFNLVTGAFREGHKDDLITQSTGIFADLKATCPRWMRFLDEVFVDEEIVDYIRRGVGYSITGVIRERAWFICHGTGFNGKSKFIEAIFKVLGGKAEDSYATDTPRKTLAKSNSNDIPADVARLVNKRFVTCSEASDVGALDEDRLKAMTGGDPQTARFMRENFFTFQPILKFWLTANSLPKVADPTDAFWDRVQPIPFMQRFEKGVNRDDTISEQLEAELPGILNWAVDGAVEWNRDGLNPPRRVLMNILSYRQKADPLAEWKTDCCILDPQAWEKRPSLWASYKAWCERNGVPRDEALGRTRFYERLLAEGYQEKQGLAGERGLLGIRLRYEGEPRQESTNSASEAKFADSEAELDPDLHSAPGSKGPRVEKAETGVNSAFCLCDGADCEQCYREHGAEWWEDEDGQFHCPEHHAQEALREGI